MGGEEGAEYGEKCVNTARSAGARHWLRLLGEYVLASHATSRRSANSNTNTPQLVQYVSTTPRLMPAF